VGGALSTVEPVTQTLSLPQILTAVWLVGMVLLVAYTVISYVRAYRKVRTAIPCGDGIYQSEQIASPFVLGFISPRIYLPFRMQERDRDHVLAHEQAHIRRLDHFWKPLGFLLLSVYWFNPLLWVGYILLCRDIELACDERVIRALDRRERADYSQTILNCSVRGRMVTPCPLAFGEVGVKTRVRSVLRYKKPAVWLVVLSLVVCVVLSGCFLTDPETDVPDGEESGSEQTTDEFEGMYEVPVIDSEQLNDPDIHYDLYVWEKAKDYYNFCLMPHFFTGRTWTETGNFSFSTLEELQGQLLRLNVKEEAVLIIPTQPIYSSYTSEYWHRSSEETDEEFAARREAYVKNIREKVFGKKDLENTNYKYDLIVNGMYEEITDFCLLPHDPDRIGIFYPPFSSLTSLHVLMEKYDVKQEEVQIIIWQAPYSSGGGYYFWRKTDETMEEWSARREAFRNKINEMVFETEMIKYDLYVWQMAKNSYSFRLLPHADRDWNSLIGMSGMPLESLKANIEALGAKREEIKIIPWQNPLSSYIGDYWMMAVNEPMDAYEARKIAYLDNIRNMVFGETE